MNLQERKNRIIARGEHSNHSHIVTGEGVEVLQSKERTVIKIPENVNAHIKHLLETSWISGEEKWTGEHQDLKLDNKGDVRHGDVYLKKIGEREYEYIQQVEFDPFEKIIRKVVD